MKNDARVRLPILLFVLSVGAAVQPASADDPAKCERMPAVDGIAQAALERVPMAGLSIAVTKGPEIIHAQGYGYAELEHRIPATAKTVYHIGSVTKQFTAAATLQLVEDGKLSLDDDIRKHLPDFSTGDRLVTIRQFLDHTSGMKSLSSIREAMTPRSLDVTQEQMMNWISSEPFDFEPGDKFRYNNSGFWLLGVIIERLSNQTYGEYIRENIFEPARMDDSLYYSYERIIPNRARGYVIKDATFLHGEVNSPTRPYAAGALLSTVLDLVKWQRALFSHQLISEDSLTLMTSAGRLNNGDAFPYGLGVGVRDFGGHRKVAHGGGYVGFSAYLAHYPDDDLTIAVLTNTQGANMATVTPAGIERQIAGLILGINVPPDDAARRRPRRQ